MQNHPIPQNVSAYEFHLIGNMTVKQFVELGVGIGAGVFFFSLPIPDFIRWPLVVISVLFGAALAFMPFDGRPLDRMVIIFFRAVYTPTQYIWRKTPEIPKYFTFIAKQAHKVDELELERQRMRKNLNEYLETLPSTGETQGDYNPQEKAYMQSIGNMFNQSPEQALAPETTQNYEFHQSPKVRVRAMKQPEQVSAATNQSIQQTVQAVSIDIPENNPITADGQTQQTTEENVEIPRASQGTPQPSSETTFEYAPENNLTKAHTSQNLPFPKPPTKPNTLVGMILTQEGKIVENAIIEIRNEKGQPVSALQSNSLGQFFSNSPLKANNYQIHTIKQGLTFAPVSIKLENKIVDPLEIRSQT